MIVIFKGEGLPKYVFFDEEEVLFTYRGWFFEELLQEEKKRLEVIIGRFTVFIQTFLILCQKSGER